MFLRFCGVLCLWCLEAALGLDNVDVVQMRLAEGPSTHDGKDNIGGNISSWRTHHASLRRPRFRARAALLRRPSHHKKKQSTDRIRVLCITLPDEGAERESNVRAIKKKFPSTEVVQGFAGRTTLEREALVQQAARLGLGVGKAWSENGSIPWANFSVGKLGVWTTMVSMISASVGTWECLLILEDDVRSQDLGNLDLNVACADLMKLKGLLAVRLGNHNSANLVVASRLRLLLDPIRSKGGIFAPLDRTLRRLGIVGVGTKDNPMARWEDIKRDPDKILKHNQPLVGRLKMHATSILTEQPRTTIAEMEAWNSCVLDGEQKACVRFAEGKSSR